MTSLFFTAILLLACPLVAAAQPVPGDVFREYLWQGPWVNAGNWQRVTDPGARHVGAAEFLPNPVNRIDIDDLAGAVRAEAYIELWGGHAGTSAKRLRLNDGDWIDIGEPGNIPGQDGTHPQAACYQYFTYPSVSIPLEQLKTGKNTFEFTCGDQVCFGFGWGQWGTYGVAFRIYYDENKIPTRGRINSPQPGASFADSLRITLEGEGGDIEQVDFFALYEDFDREGNGLYRQWHYHYRHGRISGHIGSINTSPYALTWHADWLPEQKHPIQLAARIKNSDGLYYMTEVVGDIALERSRRFVALYRPFEVPARWQTRSGSSRHSNRVFVPHNLHNAVSARLLMATWSGAHAEQIGINDMRVAGRVGRIHDYSYDEIEVPIELLKTGCKHPLFSGSLN